MVLSLVMFYLRLRRRPRWVATVVTTPTKIKTKGIHQRLTSVDIIVGTFAVSVTFSAVLSIEGMNVPINEKITTNPMAIPIRGFTLFKW